MARILMVSYRPNPGKRAEVLGHLEAQHRRIRELGVQTKGLPLLGEGIHGEVVYVIALETGIDVDRLWEDPVFQDIDAKLSTAARMVPMRTLDEASASYVDLAFLPVKGGQ